MPRASTVTRVHQAVLDLATSEGTVRLTMEGVAAKAKVGKQTIYRSWPSMTALLFDALLATSSPEGGEIPSSGNLQHDLEELVSAMILEISSPPNETLLRELAASIQLDEQVAIEFRERLLEPQLRLIRFRLEQDNLANAASVLELLIAPIFYRWFMRASPMSAHEITLLVERVLGTP